MARLINGETVTDSEVEFAVLYSVGDEDNFEYLADDEEDARLAAAVLDGQTVVRTHYWTDWAEL